MPRHIIQHGNNWMARFFTDEDARLYLDWLRGHADKTGCRVQAYVVTTNHVQLQLSAITPDGADALMEALGQRYVELPPFRTGMVDHPVKFR